MRTFDYIFSGLTIFLLYTYIPDLQPVAAFLGLVWLLYAFLKVGHWVIKGIILSFMILVLAAFLNYIGHPELAELLIKGYSFPNDFVDYVKNIRFEI